MSPNFKFLKRLFLFLLLISTCKYYAQVDTSHFKLQFAVGLNKPSSKGFVFPFESRPINASTFNLGLQYMFKTKLGFKLDYGYNRISNKSNSNSPEFKVNYTRVNGQLVADFTPLINPIAPHIGLYAHLGPGYTFIKPLREFGENKTSFVNGIVGFELHYGTSDAMSIFIDTSYIFSGADDFNPVIDGRGAFNGDMLTITVGVSLSLSGCYFCSRYE